jgi:hypothetical protein
MPRRAVGPASPTTLTVEASVTKRHGGRGDFGVVCRATAGNAGYVFSIDDDGFVAIQRYDGSPTGWRVLARLTAPSHAVKRRHRNDVVGTCTGAPGQPQHLTLVVNGYRVLDAQDNRPLDAGPGAGLSVKADGGAPVSVRFDHFVVRVSG